MLNVEEPHHGFSSDFVVVVVALSLYAHVKHLWSGLDL